MSVQVLPNGAFYAKAISTVITGMETKSRFGMPEVMNPELATQGKVAPWGVDTNLFPNEVVADIRVSSLLGPLIDWQSSKLYSEGLVYGDVEADSQGRERFKLLRLSEIDDWMERDSLVAHLQRGFRNWYAYENVWPMFQRSKGNGIAGLYYQDAFKCRHAIQAKGGFINHTYIAADWENVNSVDDAEKVQKYAALNPYYDITGQFLKSTEEFMTLPLRILSDGETYYHRAYWDGVRQSGVFKVAQAVWRLKEYLMKNQMLAKNWVEVHDDFWARQYPDWDEKKELQAQRKQAEADAFTKWSVGEINAGRTLMTAMAHREHEKGNEAYSLWKLHELKMDIPKGAYLEDSQEADAHIIRAKGVPSSLISMAPGKKMGAGSGSDQRIASTNYLLQVKSHADLLLQPLTIVSRVNGWNEKYNDGRPIRFMMRSLYTATLDRFNQVSEKPNDDGAV